MESRSRAASALLEEHARRIKFWPFARAFKIGDLDAAYDTQRAYVDLQMQERAVGPAGYKVGLTSPRMQAMCRIDQPIAGVVLADRIFASGAVLNLGEYGRLGLEFEIAVRMGKNLGARGGPPPLSEVAAAIESVHAAFEVVDDRDCDYATLDVLSLIADNSWNAGVILGEAQPPPADFAALEGIVIADGKEIDRGSGRDVLAHPLNSVAWLATHLARFGGGLRAGDIVMTGNLVTTRFPSAPSDYRFEVFGLGAVTTSVRGESRPMLATSPPSS